MHKQITIIIAALLIIAAVSYLIVGSTKNNTQYFLTVEETQTLDANARQRRLSVSGAVIGSSINYDALTPRVSFTIAQVPGNLSEIEAGGGLAQVLHTAVTNPHAPRLEIVYTGVKPDLLQDEAQAIVRGELQADGRFYADELLLKCPARYAEDIPQQIQD